VLLLDLLLLLLLLLHLDLRCRNRLSVLSGERGCSVLLKLLSLHLGLRVDKKLHRGDLGLKGDGVRLLAAKEGLKVRREGEAVELRERLLLLLLRKGLLLLLLLRDGRVLSVLIGRVDGARRV
jgi:hypothetical protein